LRQTRQAIVNTLTDEHKGREFPIKGGKMNRRMPKMAIILHMANAISGIRGSTVRLKAKYLPLVDLN